MISSSLISTKKVFCCSWGSRLLVIISTIIINLLLYNGSFAQGVRQEVLLNSNWRTITDTKDNNAYHGFEQSAFSDQHWTNVDVPHNWDTYGGYRRLKHGNLHGYAWYRKTFSIDRVKASKQYFIWFEGVGSYASIWLNGKKIGYHAGGRTSFTLNVTHSIRQSNNLLCVRADHPAFIKDLPWVCGGCSDDPGFSEGSQPMGIFRPVHLVITNDVRIEPFGVHVWNDTTVSENKATLNLETEVKNYQATTTTALLVSKLIDVKGNVVAEVSTPVNLTANAVAITRQALPNISHIHLWSPDHPYLYAVLSQVTVAGKVIDQTSMPYGIRWISWPLTRHNDDSRFYVNGKPVFINGIAEYEHLMGSSQAFSSAEIKARVMQVRAAGFNAFRDAHQPHNLEYQQYWDKLGILWWPQYSAHIWYNTPEFRSNYKTLLKEWIKERRNSPSVILWGLQNESRLPEDFAKECSDLIRGLDPTASSQRLITTCNGGRGTDWDVPQNWSGTYGGNPLNYGKDLQKEILVGEYGAWRSLDLHTSGPYVQTNVLSEDRMTQLLEIKAHLADSVKNSVAGHFMWLLYSHENPGRVQGGESLRELDRVGPVNYKGLFTVWGQPSDAFYMYRANYADKHKEPMVYIVSHTWPNRWLEPGIKDSITVYSNCDEVELFNDVNGASLGKQIRNIQSGNFQWNKVNVKYNLLYAVGYVKGKAVATDYIVLNHLPPAPHFGLLVNSNSELLNPAAHYNYLYRVNCGGPSYKDRQGNIWMADVHKANKSFWGSLSWTDEYSGMPAFFASQQRTFDPIKSTNDAVLFQSYRFGMNKLKYQFPVPDGDYRIELYFTEPWYGIGGGMNCSGWRIFDVAVNGKTVLKNLDIWREAGVNRALRKIVIAHITGGQLEISFPNVKAGEAIISAIAIATLNPRVIAAKASASAFKDLNHNGGSDMAVQSWMDIGQQVYTDADIHFNNLPSILYGADWLKAPHYFKGDLNFAVPDASDVYVASNIKPDNASEWFKVFQPTGLFIRTDEGGGTNLPVYKKRFTGGSVLRINEHTAVNTFIIAVVPVTTLEPATDLKHTVSYTIVDAELNGAGVRRDTLAGKHILRFTQKSGSNITLMISPGVADIYALRFKYYNLNGTTLTATMQLFDPNGVLMKTEQLQFKPLQKGKSGTVATTTGTSINAGNYKVVITAVDANGLVISGLEMQ